MIRIFFLSFLTSNILFAQVWEPVAAFPDAGRHHPITFSNDNYGFVVAGSYLNDVWKYDKQNDVWIEMQDFPASGRGYSYGVSIGDKAYMGLGSTDNGLYATDWWEYDMTQDLWVQKADFPGDGRNHPAMVVVGNNIYMGCGSNNNGNLNDWWEYDVLSDVWTQKPSLPANERHHPFYFGIGDYAYVGFGHGSVFGPGSKPSAGSYIYNDFYRYDPSTDSWSQRSNFPSAARVAGTQLSYGDKGYVLSGDGDDHGPLDSGEFWEYDPLNDSWVQLPSHPGNAIWAPGNFVIGCDVYFLLGQDNSTFVPTSPISVYKYKLSEDCGCTDLLALNYSSLAIYDDGSCCYISGCTDPEFINYDSLACYDDGSCIPAVLGCENPTATNYNSLANTDNWSGGALDNMIGSGSYFNGDQHLIFNSNEECVIRSADFYSESSNTITFELRDNNGNILDDTTHFLTAGKQNLILNFTVPPQTNLQLGVSAGNLSSSGLYRNNSGPSYPYNIGDLITITGSSAAQSGYYYFYYNIEVEVACIGATYDEDFIFNDVRRVVKISDVLGRPVDVLKDQILFFMYDDGSLEKRLIID